MCQVIEKDFQVTEQSSSNSTG